MAKNTKAENREANIENVLWCAAEKLIGQIMPMEYMNVCLGLIFLKYVSDRFDERYKELVAEGDGFENDRDAYTAENVFYVPKISRWVYISQNAKTAKIGEILDNALAEIEKENPDIKNCFVKTYSKGDVNTRTLGELVDLFTNNLNTSSVKGDFFGKCYEYFCGEFAKKYSQKGGEFYTPKSVVDLIVNMIEPYDNTGKGVRVYDPCCGSGGMFIQSANFIKQHQGNVDKISVYGQEFKPETWCLAKINLAIHGMKAILGDGNGDTFHDDKHKDLQADFIMANPPFNISGYGQPSLIGDPRWIYDTPPEGNANYAWIQHIVSKLAPKGVAGFVLANGSLSTNNKQEYNIRKQMLEKDGGIIDCIIALPTNLFSTVTIPASLWFLRKGRSKSNKTLFINCIEKGVMLNRKIRELTDAEILEISGIYHKWLKGKNYKDIKGFCKSATIDEIRTTDYSLVPGRYVGIDDSNKQSKEEVEAEIKKVKQELKELMTKGKNLDAKILKILNSNE